MVFCMLGVGPDWVLIESAEETLRQLEVGLTLLRAEGAGEGARGRLAISGGIKND